jgi:hypothetical protein
VWKERAKIGEDPLRVLKFSTPCLNFNLYNRNTELQKKGMEIAMFLPIAAGPLPSLLLAQGRNLGISQRLSYKVLAVPSGCPIAFRSIS